METKDFEMFSAAGNRACTTMVNRVIKKLENIKIKDNLTEMANKLLKEGIEKVAEKHAEVYDTEPRYHIADTVRRHFSKLGYTVDIDSFSIT